MLKQPWFLTLSFVGWCWLCLQWFCCWMQVACPSCSDEPLNQEPIGVLLDRPEINLGPGFSEMVEELKSGAGDHVQLEVTGKHFKNEQGGVELALSRAQAIGDSLSSYLGLNSGFSLRTQEVWEDADTAGYFQGFDVQWNELPEQEPLPPMEKVFFLAATDARFTLAEEDLAYLQEIAEYIISKKVKATVEGHTDDSGSNRTNNRMGRKRAQFIVGELKKLGVPEAQLTWENKTYLEPLVPNSSRENRAKNRRAILRVAQ
ncbi:MAG: OmpA family protein [Saprospiraceae bacterium]|nr:OmpA family protein [Saprospiraceae bacterium]